MAVAVRFPRPGRSHGRLVSEGRAQGRRFRDGGGGRAGVAQRGWHDPRGRDRVVGRGAVRRACRRRGETARRARPSADADQRGGRCRFGEVRAAGGPARSRGLQEAPGGSAGRPRAAARSRDWGCRHEGHRDGQRRQVRARGRAAHAARLLSPRVLRPHRHARRLRHLELRLLRRGDRRQDRGQIVRDVRRAGRRPRDPHRRGTRAERRAAPDPAGVLGSAWAAVRLLHARHDADVVRAAASTRRRRAKHRFAKDSPAISAAARATRTSSKPCSRQRAPCSRPRPGRQGGGHEHRSDVGTAPSARR